MQNINVRLPVLAGLDTVDSIIGMEEIDIFSSYITCPVKGGKYLEIKSNKESLTQHSIIEYICHM